MRNGDGGAALGASVRVRSVHASTSTTVKRSREPTEETEDLSRRQFGLTDLIRLVADVATIWYLSSRRCFDVNRAASPLHCVQR